MAKTQITEEALMTLLMDCGFFYDEDDDIFICDMGNVKELTQVLLGTGAGVAMQQVTEAVDKTLLTVCKMLESQLSHIPEVVEVIDRLKPDPQVMH
jgi:hypothetical protein